MGRWRLDPVRRALLLKLLVEEEDELGETQGSARSSGFIRPPETAQSCPEAARPCNRGAASDEIIISKPAHHARMNGT